MTTLALSFFPISEYNYIPQCPWNKLTGTYCPGCGSVRAAQSLVNGNMFGLVQNNPLLALSLPFFAILLFSTAFQALRGYKLFSFHITKSGIAVLSAVIIVYWVLRNYMPALAPIPS